MADHFAVIDIGSNAMRWQIAAVDHPKHYRIVAQDRQPVRLGRQVFQTGKLNPQAVEAALRGLKDFRAASDRYRVKAVRAAGTSALREASDSRRFINRARAVGIPLEVLSEQDEARLISVGIMSGLRFHLPLGLFLDIGGGSVEVTVADPANTFCLFSTPLGAVRLTEAFLTVDPPRRKDIRTLREHIQRQLKSVARRILKEKFTMAFGSGGTVTALAETDARSGSGAKDSSLIVLRRQRLQALLDLLMAQPTAERAQMISGDPKRADIIIAGGIVLHEIMSALELDYLFVSRRGLRDGLMVDLLQRSYRGSGAWHPDADRAESLEQVCQKYSHDVGHSRQVSQLALNLFYQLQSLHKLPEKYAGILHAAAMLHDIGQFIADTKHHKHSYYLIKSSGMKSFNKLDLEVIANIARYHRKAHPSQRHLGFSQLSPLDKDVVRKLSSLVRVADALDFRRERRVESVSCALGKSKTLTMTVASTANVDDEIRWAAKKGRLIEEVFNVDLIMKKTKTNRA
ncbi:MAG TPA: Ppx/GppA phosphatase family protein [Candidatus Binatia bacterium]|nr:Ppx/GppA phosphatase family protein [Candidatus Binatia bacterium]